MGLPVVIALNMSDLCRSRDIDIDAQALERELGVPVIPTVATSGLGLEVLREGIADHAENHTRFVLIGRESEPVDRRVPAKTSLLLTVDHRQGALAECLDAFAAAGFNLSKLESRRRPGDSGEYLFYLDVDAWADTAAMEAPSSITARRASLIAVRGNAWITGCGSANGR